MISHPLGDLWNPHVVLDGPRRHGAGRSDSLVDRGAWVAGIGRVVPQRGDHLGDAQHIGVEVEADGRRALLGHAAAGADSYETAQRTSATSRSNPSAISSRFAPDSACSHRASVLMPLIEDRPNRVSGSIRTGESGLSAGRQAAATSPVQVTRR
jgi:hypothetical protein